MDTNTRIRKLRKKLRQIENLERKDRNLTDEEVVKCMKKEEIRQELQQLLLEHSTETCEAEDVSGIDFDTSVATSVSSVNLSTSTPAFEADDANAGGDSPDYSQIDASLNDHDVLTGDKKKHLDVSSTGDGDKSTSETNDEKSLSQGFSPSASKQTKSQNGAKTKQKETKSQKKSAKKGDHRRSEWPGKLFSVTLLESHNDLITSVSCCENLLVSGSRDTTVKVWDLEKLEELRSLGSHTGSVTDVAILPVKQAGNLGTSAELTEDDYIVLSGSTDCSLNVWSAQTGELLKSIYTYNPVTKVAFHSDLGLAVTASDGGKLEIWNIETKENVCSETAHSDCVTGLCVSGGRLYTSCAVDGELKVFEVRDSKIHCIYASENIQNISRKPVSLRHIRSLAVKGDSLIFGDDGVNLKILAWKKGVVSKLANHREDFGMTDAICCHGDIMITSAYDLDNGQGYLNVFDISAEPVYLATIDSEGTRRILDICCRSNADNTAVTIVSAGLDLQVWKEVSSSREDLDIVKAKFEPWLAKFAQDSDIESEVEFTETESEPESGEGSRRGSVQGSGWLSWCTVI